MLKKIMRRFGTGFVLFHTGLWFIIGMCLSYFFGILPLLNRIEFFTDTVSIASLLGLVIGFIGGILMLVRMENDDQSVFPDLE